MSATSSLDGGATARSCHTRAELEQALQDSVAQRRADGRGLAVFVVDCGVVREIDAAWGYAVGDAVRARIIAGVLADALRAGDYLGELGREEFACVLSPMDDAELALLAAEKLRRVLGAPLWLGEDEICPSPVIGVALLGTDAANAADLLRQASGACLLAAQTEGRIARFEPELAASAATLVRAARLRNAVVDDALELVFQPQFDLRFGQIMGMEGMLRWGRGGQALVPLRDVVAAARDADVFAKAMSSLLNRALRNCSEFRQRAGLDLRIVLDLPVRALADAAFPDLVERALRTWSLRAGRLVLQIEGMHLRQDSLDARENMQRLHELGVRLALDDSGAPLRALYWLAELPFKELKLDLEQLQGSLDTERGRTVLGNLIELAHDLKIDVLAAAVPDEATGQVLQQLGCDYIQADFKGPVLDPESFIARFAE